jgi:RimJ/RimL family protein N-acetyltransferase
MLTCRVLFPHELQKYAYFMRERSLSSRSMYFGCAISDDGIDQLVNSMIDNPSVHHVVVAEDDNLDIVGTIHIANMSNHEVELGVMVHEGLRSQGVASTMMDFALTWCQNRNLRDIYMHCLAYNAPILHLVKKHGLEVSKDHGDADARVTLPECSFLTIGHEALLRQQNTLGYSVKKNLVSFRRMLAVQ